MGQETWSNKKWLDEQLNRGIELPNVDVLNSSTIDVSATASVGSLVISNTASIPTDTSADLNYLTVDNNGNVGKKPNKNFDVMRAYITQTGTNAPTLTILENTTGLTFTPSYSDVGEYVISPSSALTPNKFYINFTGNNDASSILSVSSLIGTGTFIQLFAQSHTGSTLAYADGRFSGWLEIIIYK